MATTTITDSEPPHHLPTSAPPPTAALAEGDSAKNESISDVKKKRQRPESFGVTRYLSEEEKRNNRAQRFGTAPTTQGSDATKNLEDQKRKARAERFGLGHGQSVSDDAEAKKKARLDRFGEAPKTNQVEEDKKKARALRFSQPPCAPNSQVNGKGNDVVPTMAIAGQADGAT